MGQEGLGGRKEGRVGERRPGGVGLPAVTSGLSAITFINPSGSHYLAATSGPCRPCPATALLNPPCPSPFPVSFLPCGRSSSRQGIGIISLYVVPPPQVVLILLTFPE